MDAGMPLFTARCLWIENSGQRPIALKAYYHYAISGAVCEPLADVPDYWANTGVWRNDASGVEYGVFPVTEDDRVSITYWKDADGNEHPDCARALDVTLAAGQRWQPADMEPVIAVFGAIETNSEPRAYVPVLTAERARSAVHEKAF
jgi:hypothetical protein